MIPYGRQEINDADIEAVAAALRAPMLTQGPTVGKFEEALAAAVGARYAVAVNSGTAALHAAYFAAGIGAGQDVLTSPITFVATVNGSYYLGGGAVLSDVDADTVMLDPATLPAPAESQRVKVLTPVHFGGQVADMSSISKIAASRRWTVVEDAAHALGASYTIDGQEYRVGACAHSSMCCFSFHPVKHVTTGEGGAVTTNDPALRDKLLRFRTHGITRAQDEMESRSSSSGAARLPRPMTISLPETSMSFRQRSRAAHAAHITCMSCVFRRASAGRSSRGSARRESV
jgi:dTDP-4-amino-4,6-dideoxygalactose transaminase